jgi:hypothetical protein
MIGVLVGRRCAAVANEHRRNPSAGPFSDIDCRRELPTLPTCGFAITAPSVDRRSFADTLAAPLQSGRGMVVPRGQTVKASLMAWLSSYMR